jgi:hypothetical protein
MGELKITEEVIVKKKEVQLLLLKSNMPDGRIIHRYACRYEGVLLPLIKDLEKANELYRYLIGEQIF